MKTDREFNCIAFKHDAQLQIHSEIKELTPEEEIKYFHRRAEASAFGKWWKKLHGVTRA